MRVSFWVATAVVALAAAFLAAPAAAWEYVGGKGRPGEVWVPPVYPFEDGRYTTYGPFLMFTTFQSGPYVYRSSGSTGAQSVIGQYIVQRWNGEQWYVASRQQTPPTDIPAGARGVYLPRLWRSPGGNQLYNRGHFRVIWVIAWAADGAGLGSIGVIPSAAGDFRCQNMVRPCQATARWVRLGRTFATGGGW
jgi:hypothetical protein